VIDCERPFRAHFLFVFLTKTIYRDNKKIKFLYGKWTDYLKSATVEDYETYLNNNSQQFNVPEKADIAMNRKQNAFGSKKAQCSSAQSTPKKLTAKLNHLSLRNFTSSLDSDVVRTSGDEEVAADSPTTSVMNDNALATEANRFEAGELNKSESSGSLDIPNARLLWIADARPDNSADFYNFSGFTFALNDLNEEMRSYLPPTDSRYRPDIRLLEAGQIG
jgi:hypothetical protein